jgi:hypothetical protein
MTHTNETQNAGAHLLKANAARHRLPAVAITAERPPIALCVASLWAADAGVAVADVSDEGVVTLANGATVALDDSISATKEGYAHDHFIDRLRAAA